MINVEIKRGENKRPCTPISIEPKRIGFVQAPVRKSDGDGGVSAVGSIVVVTTY